MPQSVNKERQRVTMRDVAQAAGVSIATASYVLGGKRLSKVSPKTQDIVLKAAHELGYRPNRMARSLTTQRSYAIGVVCADIAFPLFGAAVKAIESVVSEQDYHVVLHNTGQQPEAELSALHFLEELRVDGAIFISTSNAQDSTHLVGFAKKFPFVIVNRAVEEEFSGITVSIAHDEAGRQAAKHLIEQGRKRLAFIGSTIHNAHPAHAAVRRHEGFQRGVMEAGLNWQDVYVHLDTKGRFDAADGYRATSIMLSKGHVPDGIYAINDYAAAGCIRALLESGLRVPDDVAVIGNDNLELASRFVPSITSLSQRLDHAGFLAAKIVLAKIDDVPIEASQRIIQPKLVVRESTDAGSRPFPKFDASLPNATST